MAEETISRRPRFRVSQSTLDEMRAVSERMNANRDKWDRFLACKNEALRINDSLFERMWWANAEEKFAKKVEIPYGYGSF